MAEAIYVLLDTDMLEDYIDTNMWLFVDNELDDETHEKVVDYVVKASTEGKLKHMISECLDTWTGEKFCDMVYETVDDFIRDAISESGIDLGEEE